MELVHNQITTSSECITLKSREASVHELFKK